MKLYTSIKCSKMHVSGLCKLWGWGVVRVLKGYIHVVVSVLRRVFLYYIPVATAGLVWWHGDWVARAQEFWRTYEWAEGHPQDWSKTELIPYHRANWGLLWRVVSTSCTLWPEEVDGWSWGEIWGGHDWSEVLPEVWRRAQRGRDWSVPRALIKGVYRAWPASVDDETWEERVANAWFFYWMQPYLRVAQHCVRVVSLRAAQTGSATVALVDRLEPRYFQEWFHVCHVKFWRIDWHVWLVLDPRWTGLCLWLGFSGVVWSVRWWSRRGGFVQWLGYVDGLRRVAREGRPRRVTGGSGYFGARGPRRVLVLTRRVRLMFGRGRTLRARLRWVRSAWMKWRVVRLVWLGARFFRLVVVSARWCESFVGQRGGGRQLCVRRRVAWTLGGSVCLRGVAWVAGGGAYLRRGVRVSGGSLRLRRVVPARLGADRTVWARVGVWQASWHGLDSAGRTARVWGRLSLTLWLRIRAEDGGQRRGRWVRSCPGSRRLVWVQQVRGRPLWCLRGLWGSARVMYERSYVAELLRACRRRGLMSDRRGGPGVFG